jgi:2-polyprenyl-3-methyl-5-hydroxy-6-metoxy-1,4-benzoquinol methylase
VKFVRPDHWRFECDKASRQQDDPGTLMNDRVREQYESYPYPHRDPADESRLLRIGSPSHIDEINHYIYAGHRDFREPFRALIAGGGSGDGLIMLAQQLADAHCPSEVVYLDLSHASRKIAEARAQARGLTNIRYIATSLLDAPQYGPFDYIDCCGVLHHLEVPQSGFTALAKALKPDGGMGIMVYGTLGRTGVYPMQEMLRTIVGDGDRAYPERIDIAKRLIEELPPTNWLLQNKMIGDYKRSDAGLVDLLLHSRDRPYRVHEVADEVDAAGLRLVTFIEPVRYDPFAFVSDPIVRERIAELTWLDRCAFAELLAGDLLKHIFYCVRADNEAHTIAKADSANAIPMIRDVSGPNLGQTIEKNGTLKVELSGKIIDLDLPVHAAAILKLVDGQKPLQMIHQQMEGGIDWVTFYQQFSALYNVLNRYNKMTIRYAPPN